MKRVILVHGIREYGLWFTTVEKALRAKHAAVDRVGFNYLNALRFLMRGGARARAEANVRTQIRGVFDAHPEDDISIIAFSFGTHAAIKALATEPTLKPDVIIFSGAVASLEENDWSAIARRTKRSLLLNEVGTNDPWPVVAEAFGAGYGQPGSRAANVPEVLNRFHAAWHTPTFKKEGGEPVYDEWARIIVDGDSPAPSDDQRATPFWFAWVQPFIRVGLPALAVGTVALLLFHKDLERLGRTPIPPWTTVSIEQLRSEIDLSGSQCTPEGRQRVEARTDEYSFSNYVADLRVRVLYDDVEERPVVTYVNSSAPLIPAKDRHTTEDAEEYAGVWLAQADVEGHDLHLRWRRPANLSRSPPGGVALFPGDLPTKAIRVMFEAPPGSNVDVLQYAQIIDRAGNPATIGDRTEIQCGLIPDGIECNFDALPSDSLPATYGLFIPYRINRWACSAPIRE